MPTKIDRAKLFLKHFKMYMFLKRKRDLEQFRGLSSQMATIYFEKIDGEIAPDKYEHFLLWLADKEEWFCDISKFPTHIYDYRQKHNLAVFFGGELKQLDEKFLEYLSNFREASYQIHMDSGDERFIEASSYASAIPGQRNLWGDYTGKDIKGCVGAFHWILMNSDRNFQEVDIHEVHAKMHQMKQELMTKESKQEALDLVNTITKKMEA